MKLKQILEELEKLTSVNESKFDDSLNYIKNNAKRFLGGTVGFEDGENTRFGIYSDSATSYIFNKNNNEIICRAKNLRELEAVVNGINDYLHAKDKGLI